MLNSDVYHTLSSRSVCSKYYLNSTPKFKEKHSEILPVNDSDSFGCCLLLNPKTLSHKILKHKKAARAVCICCVAVAVLIYGAKKIIKVLKCDSNVNLTN